MPSWVPIASKRIRRPHLAGHEAAPSRVWECSVIRDTCSEVEFEAPRKELPYITRREAHPCLLGNQGTAQVTSVGGCTDDSPLHKRACPDARFQKALPDKALVRDGDGSASNLQSSCQLPRWRQPRARFQPAFLNRLQELVVDLAANVLTTDEVDLKVVHQLAWQKGVGDHRLDRSRTRRGGHGLGRRWGGIDACRSKGTIQPGSKGDRRVRSDAPVCRASSADARCNPRSCERSLDGCCQRGLEVHSGLGPPRARPL